VNSVGWSIKKLEADGFDQSRQIGVAPNTFRIGCSQCEALSINGIPTHETGCSNQVKRYYCKGCGIEIGGNWMYCEECA
jgi:hypothetical protein